MGITVIRTEKKLPKKYKNEINKFNKKLFIFTFNLLDFHFPWNTSIFDIYKIPLKLYPFLNKEYHIVKNWCISIAI